MMKTLSLRGTEIEDTYCEAFQGVYARLLITADTKALLLKAARSFSALPSTVFNKSEGGIEKLIPEEGTPDKRPGAIVQLWVNDGKRAKTVLEDELGWRIRQGVLVVPTTRVYNALKSKDMIDPMPKIGHCGDGYETVERLHHRKVIKIPIMMGDFYIERFLGLARGIMGGNLWFFCKSTNSALDISETALGAIKGAKGVITPFDVCAAGSKVETNYPEIGPTTNHPYCPSLKDSLEGSKVPEEVEAIPEIVINGTSLENVKKAMHMGIMSVSGLKGLLLISCGNFGGRLGKYKIWLRDLVK
jgi:formylmethanofuran--tetrahydromethanopterin N-formyltransferase